MKQYTIKGIVASPGQPTTQISLVVNANDQSSARRLVQMQYASGGKVTIQSITETRGK